MSPEEHLSAESCDGQVPVMVGQLAELVACESPTADLAGLRHCAELLRGWGDAAVRRAAEVFVVQGRPHLLWRPSRRGVLVLGHFDTVWPVGTLAEWPFTVVDGVARGPGVFDMKAGIVQALAAIAALKDTERVGLLLTSDEEIGSPTSRELIGECARQASAVLVCEPSADGGAVKIGRKGMAGYTVRVHGRAAHAGLEPHLGVNATVELARQVLAVAGLSRDDLGTTVTPTVVSAGTTANTVPATAELVVDARAWTVAELDRVDAAMRALTPFLPGARLVVDGGVNQPPWEPAVSLALLAEVQDAARDNGLPVPEGVLSGGASDGNWVASLGVPTLDGLGAVGAHPHNLAEQVDVAAMPRQAALLAALIRRLVSPSQADGAGTG